jgi:hypothetical protein
MARHNASVEHAALAMYRGSGYAGAAVEGRAVLMLMHASLACAAHTVRRTHSCADGVGTGAFRQGRALPGSRVRIRLVELVLIRTVVSNAYRVIQ